jgi:hypothetical protein
LALGFVSSLVRDETVFFNPENIEPSTFPVSSKIPVSGTCSSFEGGWYIPPPYPI